MARHRVCLFGEALDTGELTVVGDEAKHALRVKRIGVGDPIDVVNGLGQIGTGVVVSGGKGGMVVRIDAVGEVARVRPAVEVCGAIPKGNRAEKMIDALVQVGCARWSPLETRFGVIEPSEGKMGRVDRVAGEALKQSGRAWAMEIGGRVGFVDACVADGGARVVIADSGGGAYRADGSQRVRVLIGAEGGWSEQERAIAQEAGVERAAFGPEVMRIEVAAPVAVGIVLALETAHES